MRLSCPFLLLLCFLTAAAQQPDANDNTGYVIRTDASEVIVDLVVRDKNGQPTLDLTAAEVQILEQGQPQQIVSFRKVEGGRVELLGGAAGASPVAPAANLSRSAGPQMRLAQLVTLVFERLDNTSRNLAYRAARDFVRTELSDNVYVSVYVLDRSLHPIQEFTQDRDALESAIETATGRNRTDFYTESEFVERRLAEFLQKSAGASLQQAGSIENSQAAPDVDAMVAQRAYQIAQRSEQMAREVEAGGSLFSMIALARSLNDLAGRKTVLLFSEGFAVPPNFESHLDTLVNEANRGQVSFYTFDARGLETTSQLDTAKRLLTDAAANSRSQQELSNSGQQRGFSQAEIQALDNAQASIRGNRQGTLQEIAARTGGEFVGNTNNFSRQIKRLTEDIFSYYEISYRPKQSALDGSFRPVSVTVSRPEAKVQSRDGYSAIPPAKGDIVISPFELPMLAQLAAGKLPSELAHHSGAYTFRRPDGAVTVMGLAEMPLSALSFETVEERSGKSRQALYQGSLAMLAQLTADSGEIVAKASQLIPLRGEASRLEALKRGNFVFRRQWSVAPGVYQFETVFQDLEGKTFGAAKTPVEVRGPAGLDLSSLALIKSVGTAKEQPKKDTRKGKDGKKENGTANAAEDTAAFDPFDIRAGEITPTAGTSVSRNSGGAVSFFFVVYPDPAVKSKPTLLMEYYKDGQLVGQGAPELPQPEPDGTIPYVATTPAAAFPAGEYQMLVEIAQGESKARRTARFVITE